MTEPRDDDLLRWDETLLEGEEELPAKTLPADPTLRAELLRQRLVHGLLTAVNEKDKVAARERRVQAIVSTLPVEHERGRVGGRVVRMRPWLSLAAAVIVSAVIALVVALRGETPRLEAMIDQAVLELQSDIDRRYRVRAEERQPSGEYQLCGTHTITVRPGKMRLSLDGQRTGRWEVGSDGAELWRYPHSDPTKVEARPVAEAEDLLAEFLSGGLVNLGCLDLARVLDGVPDDTPLHSEHRDPLNPDGPELEEIFVDGGFEFLGGNLSKLTILIDPAIDEVHRVAFLLDGPTDAPDRSFRLIFKFEGILSEDLGGDHLYVRPR